MNLVLLYFYPLKFGGMILIIYPKVLNIVLEIVKGLIFQTWSFWFA